MIKRIRNSKVAKIIAIYLAMMIFLQVTAPMAAYALTGGPEQPEFGSFTPIGTSDMVDLSSGNFNYNIPIMDVGGYPLNLAYNAGITMDQEASWVGLGWNMDVGEINREVRGLPDDFNGDKILYENNMKDNVTIGANFNLFATPFGLRETTDAGGFADTVSAGKINVGLGVKYNSYDGFSSSLSGGISYQISDNLSVGMNMTSSASEGVSVSPALSLHAKYVDKAGFQNSLTGSVGTSLNSRKGFESVTFSASRTRDEVGYRLNERGNVRAVKQTSGTTGGSISLLKASYTPAKRVGMRSTNIMFNLNYEGELWGFEGGAKFSGYRSLQGIKDSEKYKFEKAYGFENSFNGTDYDILDFNREKDRTFNSGTTSLPVTNHTFDIYSIQGQGISGMFRPYKGQIGYIHDNYINDDSTGGDLGIEFGSGGGAHFGVDISVTSGNSSTSTWRSSNQAIQRFEEDKTGNRPDYEKVFFKNIGGFHVDNDYDIFKNQMGGYRPVRFELSGGKLSRQADSKFAYKTSDGVSHYINIDAPIKHTKRLNRNQPIQKLNLVEAAKFGLATQQSPYAVAGLHNDHTAEIQITKEGGDRYIYGRAAYNITKKEVSFNVSGQQPDCTSGLVSYTPGSHNSLKNSAGDDHYFNRITTPSYAHTYLLTAMLSSDYSDLTKNGPTDDDLGNYTRFVYNDKKTKSNTYKWRAPYKSNTSNYDEGLKSVSNDQKGSYLYGEKEMLYIDTIITKTHIAIFSISERKDGIGVEGENGGGSASTASKSYKLDKITLYSKPEFEALGTNAVPIKTANFVYDYTLCQNIDNNFYTVLGQKGKLTLKQVYFTYGKSNLGKYTPYNFTYGFNPSYNIKAYDVWGNYKPSTSSGCGLNDPITNAEFPFVEQNKTKADQYASAWLLQTIDLPSGGKIEVQYESDDYKYVQDKEAMQMFKVVGASASETGDFPTNVNGFSTKLFNTGEPFAKRLFIKLPSGLGVDNVNSLKNKYLKGLQGQPIYFRFLLNMSKPGTGNDEKYDYVSGYFELEDFSNNGYQVNQVGSSNYASIPIKLVSKGDGFNSGDLVNPISKAGWNFGKKYLNRYVYTNSTDPTTDDLEEIVKDIIGSVPAMIDIVKSPNKQLIERRIAHDFIAEKSWIRLMCPENKKYGGGARVKQITLSDQWDKMTSHEGNDLYKQSYGQQYFYDLTDGSSSGVASYEPLGDKENPLVQPFYDRQNLGRLQAPEGDNYIEKPFGESFYPSPKITYSRVTVKNLPRIKTTGTTNTITENVQKHATGTVISEFFTTKDYPTISSVTDLRHFNDKSNVLASLLNLNVRDNLTLSQGFTIHTNDMDGKPKSEFIYAEGATEYISGTTYSYDNISQASSDYQPEQGKLDNKIVTIDSKGNIAEKLVGVDYDVINDFRENKSVTSSAGLKVNVAALPFTLLVIVVPTPIPSFSRHESQLRTAVTTKLIHSSGILRKVTVFDAGSSVSTQNLAWDAETGEVLVTQTINEYNDKYYSLNYPAYWNYKGMGQAASNIGMTWSLKDVPNQDGNYQFYTSEYKAADYLHPGDELWMKPDADVASANAVNMPDDTEFKAYVVSVNNNTCTLINEKGIYVTVDAFKTGSFTIIRSGHRNQQSASMASIVSMVNPIYNGNVPRTAITDFTEQAWDQFKIVNSAAVEYEDEWAAQCECRLPKMKFKENGKLNFNYTATGASTVIAYNPYRYNIKGNWRPKISYAYLTGRNVASNPTPRSTGFYNKFSSFYRYDATLKKWVINKNGWTFASKVTQYSPYGFEMENKDTLNRYSSAIYGYNFRFPIAVASNTKYSELAFDGFEDYEFSKCDTTSHFSVDGNLMKNKVTISPDQAHTGRKSLKMAPQSRAVIKKQIIPCD